MRKFVELTPEEQEQWRVWARARRAEGHAYREIVADLAGQGISVSVHTIMAACDEVYRRNRLRRRLEHKKLKYATDPEYRKKQHKRVAARRKVRLATDPAYRERVFKRNNERRRLKAAAERAAEK